MTMTIVTHLTVSQVILVATRLVGFDEVVTADRFSGSGPCTDFVNIIRSFASLGYWAMPIKKGSSRLFRNVHRRMESSKMRTCFWIPSRTSL